MDVIALAQLLMTMFRDHLVGDSENVLPDQAWRLTREGSVSLIGVLPEPAHIRITTGVVTDLTPSGDLGLHLSVLNQQLWNGRAYLAPLDQGSIASVFLQDIIFGDSLPVETDRCIDIVSTAINTLTRRAELISPDILRAFGGRPFTDSDLPKLFD